MSSFLNIFLGLGLLSFIKLSNYDPLRLLINILPLFIYKYGSNSAFFFNFLRLMDAINWLLDALTEQFRKEGSYYCMDDDSILILGLIRESELFLYNRVASLFLELLVISRIGFLSILGKCSPLPDIYLNSINFYFYNKFIIFYTQSNS